ncbi:MAG: 6-carboxytetrahydropterin synthase [Flavobacteriales bacterium]|jgi:6-pyruvoyltetrahydropterin/6-carboxytetrahydropterin synthase|nr:6-carboxytetrahydropterin synthase [Flavobacteriales bacterium]
MPHTRITKRFTLEMAHALRGYAGPCRHIHGHSYVLDITVSGTRRPEGDPHEGMVMDFGLLKALVHRAVLSTYDHALVLHADERDAIPAEHPLFARTLFVPWQPTCENLLHDMAERIRRQLPPDVSLAHAHLQETATSWAEHVPHTGYV